MHIPRCRTRTCLGPMMSAIRRCLWLAAFSMVATATLAEEPPAPEPPGEQPVSYYRDVRPIFQAHCQGCHQPAKPEGGLVMSEYAGLFKEGDSEEPSVLPGNPEDSLLMFQIVAEDGEPPPMPKDADPLTDEQVDLIRRWIAAGAHDDTPPSARITVDAEHPPVYTLPPLITSLDYSPSGDLLAVSGYHEVLIHRADGSEIAARLIGLSERIESAVFSPDGKQLAVTGGSPGRFGEVQIWNTDDWQLALSLPVTYDTVYGASWSPDGKLVAFGCADNTFRAIEAATGKQVLYQGAHNDWVLDTVFSVDSSHLVSVSRDRSMKLTEVATERFVDNITSITPGALKGGLAAVDRHPQKDELLIGGADGVPKIYKMYRTQDRKIGDDYNLLRAFDTLPGRIFSAAYSRDGKLIIIGSSSDRAGTVRVYRADDGHQVSEYSADLAPVFAVAFGADDSEAAVGGFDGMVRIIDPRTGRLVREFLSVPLASDEVATATQP